MIDGPRILEMQRLVREVVLAPHVQDYAVRLVLATHPQGPHAVDAANKWLRFGSGPRNCSGRRGTAYWVEPCTRERHVDC